jgi:hypothetical protein
MNAQIASLSSVGGTPTLARLSVERLSSRLENEKRELVLFLIELADFDAKKLALELGYPSTLGCLVTELRLSESSACRRIAAARLLARFPRIGSYLLASRLTLMSLVALKEVLDDSNVDELLERASGLSEPEVRQLVLRLAESPTFAQLAPATPAAATVAADPVATAMQSAPTESFSDGHREDLQALTLWVGRELREELEAVRTLLGHAVPGGKKEDVLLHILRAQRKVLERGDMAVPSQRASRRNRRPAPTTFRRRCGARFTSVKAEPAPTWAKNSAAVARRCGSSISISFLWLAAVRRHRRTSLCFVGRTTSFRRRKTSATSTFGRSGSNEAPSMRRCASDIRDDRRSRLLRRCRAAAISHPSCARA